MAVVRTVKKSALRDYMPLAMASLVMLGLLAVLPSALNLPQTNPSQTLEYAPVPPEDDQVNPPASGNFSSLGLGSSSGVGARGEPSGPPADMGGAVGGGKAVKTASTKRCVGSPPRQTEDPLSPPCVASYTGDNGGATYAGVTKDEVRVVYYMTGGTCRSPTSRGRECAPRDTYVDLGAPPTETEDVVSRGIRDLQNYFNDRFQTYGRFVHFWVYYDGGPTVIAQPETQKAKAIEAIKRIDPFAAVDGSGGTHYMLTMARRGVMVFQSTTATPLEFFRRYPKLIWNYLPAVELHARTFSSMLCRQVVGRPAAFSGNPGENGKPRRLGLLRPNDDAAWGEGYHLFGELVKAQIEECGGQFVAEGEHPYTGRVNDGSAAAQQQVEQNIATFRQAQVSTIIWPLGLDLGRETETAARQGYLPEWILAGDTIMEGYDVGQLQDQRAMRHAWIQTTLARQPAFNQDLCYLAMSESNPGKPEEDARQACLQLNPYEALRQLFIGIQVAGPKLHPNSVDKGFHAIPPGPSNDPLVPACYYDPGDYSCVKDGTAMYWDTNGRAPGSNSPGCWRMPDEGKRYVADTWPDAELSSRVNPASDPCNGFSAGAVNTQA